MRRVVDHGDRGRHACGRDAETSWESLKAGRSGIRRIDYYDVSTFPVQIAGICDDFDLSQLPDADAAPYLHRGRALRRRGRRGGAAQRGARAGHVRRPSASGSRSEAPSTGRSSRSSPTPSPCARRPKDGSCTGSRRSRRCSTARTRPCAEIARVAGADGPVIGISTACTASAHSIGEAFRLIQDDEVDMMVAGGFDALTTWCDLLGFSLLGALTTQYNDDPEHASRPFDRDRSGFVLGEGGVVVVLEEREAAEARGARILGGARRLRVEPEPLPHDRSAARRRRRRARDERRAARGRPADRATSTTWSPTRPPRRRATCPRRSRSSACSATTPAGIVVTSPKCMTGHTTCAASALNLLAGVFAMRDGVVSPTINLDNQDPEVRPRLRPERGARARRATSSS